MMVECGMELTVLLFKWAMLVIHIVQTPVPILHCSIQVVQVMPTHMPSKNTMMGVPQTQCTTLVVQDMRVHITISNVQPIHYMTNHVPVMRMHTYTCNLPTVVLMIQPMILAVLVMRMHTIHNNAKHRLNTVVIAKDT